VSRYDEVTLKFFDDEGDALEVLKGELSVVEQPRPLFAYSWQLVDKCDKCNGDGLAQPGETVELVVDVKNVGVGKAQEVLVALKNKGDEKIYLTKGRAKIGELLPGASKTATFEFEIKPNFESQSAPLQLTLGDEATEEAVTEKIVNLPVSLERQQGKPHQVAVRANQDLQVFSAATEQSSVIGTLKKGAALASDARFGEMYRTPLGNRLGFVKANKVAEVALAKAQVAKAIDKIETRSQPRITLSADTSNGGLVVDADRFALSGNAASKRGLRDLYIYVNDQKIFYASPQDGAEPDAPIRFSVELPLKVGNNAVVVVAREDQDFMARKILLIHRRGEPSDASKPTMYGSKPGALSPDAKPNDDRRHRAPPEGGVVPAPLPPSP